MPSFSRRVSPRACTIPSRVQHRGTWSCGLISAFSIPLDLLPLSVPLDERFPQTWSVQSEPFFSSPFLSRFPVPSRLPPSILGSIHLPAHPRPSLNVSGAWPTGCLPDCLPDCKSSGLLASSPRHPCVFRPSILESVSFSFIRP